VLEVQHLSCARGDRPLFGNLNFSLDPGQALHILGPNGCGKTTLLRTLCGLTHPEAGTVLWQGETIDTAADNYRNQINYIGHNYGLHGDLNALENLHFTQQLYVARSRDLRSAIEKMGLNRVATLPSKLLSQGQKHRLALARLLVCDTPLWILDEPFTALDQDTTALFQDIMTDHLQHDGMMVLTAHHAVSLPKLNTLSLNEYAQQ